MSINKPRDRPTVPEVLPMCRELYHDLHQGAGGPLHIVLDDGNLCDSSIQFCIDCSIPEFEDQWEGKTEEVKELSLRIADLLLRMTMTQRRKIYAAHFRV